MSKSLNRIVCWIKGCKSPIFNFHGPDGSSERICCVRCGKYLGITITHMPDKSVAAKDP